MNKDYFKKRTDIDENWCWNWNLSKDRYWYWRCSL